jgi:dihydroorotate dehydrogenase (fumarate)
MNLNTTYLNLSLQSPLVVSASPLSKSLDNIKRMEDAGASAIVLFSLFEEQVRIQQRILTFLQEHANARLSDAQALFPSPDHVHVDLENYLIHIQQCKQAVKIPIIASLNCTSMGVWADYTRQLEQAGADALELNVYYIPTDIYTTAAHVEDMYITILKMVKSTVQIPVAIKLTPFFTNLAHVARRLDQAGADGLVLFNRFFQPDFDPRTLQLQADVPLGTPNDSRLPLHWIAILYGRVKADLAATGGLYTAEDMVKMLMVGAKVTMLASVLYQEGINHISTLEQNLRTWLDQNDYKSVEALQGILRQFHSENTSVLERKEYIQTITSTGENEQPKLH